MNEIMPTITANVPRTEQMNPGVFDENQQDILDVMVPSLTESTPDDQHLMTRREIMDAERAANKDNSRANSKKWMQRIALGTLAVGSAYALSQNNLSDMADDLREKAPYVAVSFAATEAMWLGGAAMMLGSMGNQARKSNVFTLHKNFSESIHSIGDTSSNVLRSSTFKNGLTMNTLGAIGTAGTVAFGAVAALPHEMWPGAFGVAALDIAATMGVRTPIRQAIKTKREQAPAAAETEKHKVTVRNARETDIDRLADIDLALFNKAYGEKLPSKESVVDMLTKRYENTSWMLVAERDGKVEGFVSAFRTNKSAEEFKSWEDCTNHGTLEGKVDPNGKYVYVTNMTIEHDSVVEGAKDMLLATLIAEGIKDGIEYGYFESRMPYFKRWLEKNNIADIEGEELMAKADEYANMRLKNGKRFDPQLRMYEGDGFQLGTPVANAFEDSASMNFGVVCKAPIPARTAPAPVRWVLGSALTQVAKFPKILKKVI